MTKVKICGARTPTDAKIIEQSGADFIGFVFAPSKRQLTIEQASEMAEELDTIKKVGVFVNPSAKEVQEAIEQVPLDYVQLHGDEPADLADQFKGRVIKAFPSNSEKSYSSIFDYPAEYILMDSPRKKHYGGSGVTFNWNQLNHTDVDKSKFVLAGGLKAENVQEAIHTVRPAVIDISSGVETENSKDPEKINQLMKNVRSI